MNNTITKAEKLSPQEQYDFQRAEQVIRTNLKAFMEVGGALVKIRDSRLYRESHATFEQYCKDKWGFSRNYANKMIAAAAVVDNLGTTVPTPQNEAQARPLTKLPVIEQAAAWTKATEIAKDEGRKVTADDVEKAVAKHIPEESLQADDQPQPTRIGRKCARKAVDELRVIQPDDTEREEAFLAVINFCQMKLDGTSSRRRLFPKKEDPFGFKSVKPLLA